MMETVLAWGRLWRLMFVLGCWCWFCHNGGGVCGQNVSRSNPHSASTTKLHVVQIATFNFTQALVLRSNEIHLFELYRPPTDNYTDISPFLTIVVATNATVGYPLFVSARGRTNSYSWKVPHEYLFDTAVGDQDGPKRARNSKEVRTLCMDGTRIQLELSTSSPDPVDVAVSLSEVADYKIGMKEQKSVVISPMERQFFYFEMPNDLRAVLVRLTSPDNVCAKVTVDTVTCMAYNGDKATENRQNTYQYIKPDNNPKDWAALAPKIRQTMTRKSSITVYRKHIKLFHIIIEVPVSNGSCADFGNPRVENKVVVQQRHAKNVSIVIEKMNVDSYFAILWYPVLVLGMAAVILIVCICPPLAAYMDYPEKPLYERPKRQKQRSDHRDHSCPPGSIRGSFLFSLLVIAAFYSLPAVQLLFHHQREYRVSGNQDICYYNFLCLRPLGHVSAFNNIYSNLSYVIFGLTFLVMVRVHSRRLAWRYREVFYAMGMALVLEGVLSAGYHICPTAHNFQFDTTFMYIISGLCIYHLYQIRNPHVLGYPHKFYGIFAGAGVYVVLGIFSSELGWRIAVTITYGITAIAIGALVMHKLYIHNVVAKSHRTAQRIMGFIQGFLTLLLIAYSLYALVEEPDSFPSILLNLFIGNLFFFTIFYFTLKIANHEALVAGSILCVILALASWCSSLYFFTGQRITDWQLTPAASRSLNQECIFLDFFDAHDVWHLLSSFSLFVSFILLLSLDVGVDLDVIPHDIAMQVQDTALHPMKSQPGADQGEHRNGATSDGDHDSPNEATLEKSTKTSDDSEVKNPDVAKKYRCFIDE